MHERKDISDKIGQLFNLSVKDFNPILHFSLADEIVRVLGKPSYFFRLQDFVSSKKYPAKKEKVGNYLVRPLGFLALPLDFGLDSALLINYWKDDLFDTEINEELLIGYHSLKSCHLIKRVTESYSLTLPLGIKQLITFEYRAHKDLWSFER